MKKKIIFILGPTSSGKSLLAIELAKHINGEIISADSIQIYKHINILSGKVSLKERDGITHHMLDIIEPSETFSVFKYIEMTKKILNDIFIKNKIPIIAGGTGLYTKVITNNKIMKNNIEIRERLINITKNYGNKFMFKWLNDLNYDLNNQNIHYNNIKRIIRKLEIFYDNIHINKNINNNCNEIFQKEHIIKIILLPLDRNDLYKQINNRVDLMLKKGLLNEVKNLFSNFNLSSTAKQAIGYKELLPYFNNSMDLSKCIDVIKQKSRNYAKKQITWFKNQEKTHFIYYDHNFDLKNILKKIIIIINKELT